MFLPKHHPLSAIELCYRIAYLVILNCLLSLIHDRTNRRKTQYLAKPHPKAVA